MIIKHPQYRSRGEYLAAATATLEAALNQKPGPWQETLDREAAIRLARFVHELALRECL
jgi:hypothetical protein